MRMQNIFVMLRYRIYIRFEVVPLDSNCCGVFLLYDDDDVDDDDIIVDCGGDIEQHPS